VCVPSSSRAAASLISLLLLLLLLLSFGLKRERRVKVCECECVCVRVCACVFSARLKVRDLLLRAVIRRSTRKKSEGNGSVRISPTTTTTFREIFFFFFSQLLLLFLEIQLTRARTKNISRMSVIRRRFVSCRSKHNTPSFLPH